MSNTMRNQLVVIVRNDYRRTVYQIKRAGGAFMRDALANAKRIYRTAMKKIALMSDCSRDCEPFVNLLMRNTGMYNHKAIEV
jgi:hypothetical protein